MGNSRRQCKSSSVKRVPPELYFSTAALFSNLKQKRSREGGKRYKHKPKLKAQSGRGQAAKHKPKPKSSREGGKRTNTNQNQPPLSAPPQIPSPLPDFQTCSVPCWGSESAGARLGLVGFGLCWFACPLPDCFLVLVCVSPLAPFPTALIDVLNCSGSYVEVSQAHTSLDSRYSLADG